MNFRETALLRIAFAVSVAPCFAGNRVGTRSNEYPLRVAEGGAADAVTAGGVGMAVTRSATE